MEHSLTILTQMPEGTILSFDANLLFTLGIQILNVILLTAVLFFLLYKPVKKFIAGRSERIQKEIDEAGVQMEQAMELKEKYEQLISDIEKEREEILHQTHQKAVEKSDQLLFDARHEAEMMYTRAMSDLETERENLTDEMKRQIIEISTMMASKFVEVSMDRETQDKFIDQALSQWEVG